MTDATSFADVPATTLADLLDRGQVMDIGIRPLWPWIPRVAGPAFTVRCPAGDNLMLHAAIYRAAPGSVIVVEAVVVPSARQASLLSDASARLAREAGESLDAWEQAHQARISKILADGGFAG